MPPKSLSYTTGDVLCLLFPNEEDSNQYTVRWAICVDDFGSTVKIIPLKKVLDPSKIEKEQKFHPKTLFIKLDSTEGKSMGLKYDSLIIPERSTIIKKVACFVNGKCPQALFNTIISLI